MIASKKVALGLLALFGTGVSTTAVAQFSITEPPEPLFALAAPAVTEDGQPVTLQEGKQYKLPNGQIIVITKDTKVTPGMTLTDESGKKIKIQRPSKYASLAIFPQTAFSIAGPIILPSGAVEGGTITIFGNIISAGVGRRFDDGRKALEVGGWYFIPNKSGNDLYQAHVRYFFDKDLGFQLAYIDSFDQNAASASGHVIYQLSSSRVAPELPRTWDVELGVGALGNFTREFKSGEGFVKRSSFNFSTYFQARYALDKNLSLYASYWFVRDRNVDVNRFGLGIGMKF